MRTIVHSVRTFVLICLLFATTTKAFSQSITTGNGKFEFGLGLGPMFFLGDLGGNKGIGKGTWLKDVMFPSFLQVQIAFLGQSRQKLPKSRL